MPQGCYAMRCRKIVARHRLDPRSAASAACGTEHLVQNVSDGVKSDAWTGPCLFIRALCKFLCWRSNSVVWLRRPCSSSDENKVRRTCICAPIYRQRDNGSLQHLFNVHEQRLFKVQQRSYTKYRLQLWTSTETQVGLVTLTFDLLTLKVVSETESRVTWATSVPILVFLGLSVLDLGPMYATDVRQKHRLIPPPIRGGGITKLSRVLEIVWQEYMKSDWRHSQLFLCSKKCLHLRC